MGIYVQNGLRGIEHEDVNANAVKPWFGNGMQCETERYAWDNADF
jgi:hypothetical protein